MDKVQSENVRPSWILKEAEDSLVVKFIVLSVLQAILQNSLIEVESELHTALTILMDILLSHSEQTTSLVYSVKQYAAFLLSILLNRFQNKYKQLRSQTILILMSVIQSSDHSLISIYGAIQVIKTKHLERINITSLSTKDQI